jgi:hypothetical protein
MIFSRYIVMPELSYNHSANIVKTVATFLSSVATAIASFTIIVTLMAVFGGKRIVNIQDDEAITLLIFVISSLLVSLFILGLSCFVWSLLSKVSTDGFK